MKRTAHTASRATPERQELAARPRLPVLLGGMLLAWSVGWYGRGGSQTLFIAVVALTVLALLRSRPLPGTTRAVAWTGVFCLVVMLAANAERVVSPADRFAEWQVYDRMASLALACGVTALFFRPGAAVVTACLLAGLPPLMLAMVRVAGEYAPLDKRLAQLAVWGFFALLLLFDQGQRLCRGGGTGRRAGGAETATRLLLVGGALALAVALRPPLRTGVLALRTVLLGLLQSMEDHTPARRQVGTLNVGATVPPGFDSRMRVLLAISTPSPPLFLREAVYVVYEQGAWRSGKPGSALTALPGGTPAWTEAGWSVYPLTAANSVAPGDSWRCEVVEGRLLANFCLPGSALLLSSAGEAPRADPDGGVLPDGRLPDRYDLLARRDPMAASPLPDPTGNPNYTNLPPQLAQPAADWLAACEGLPPDASAVAVAEAIARHFSRHFRYLLGVRLQSRPDPLIDFMLRREGHCTHFASACAMMLRARGIPCRVVAGYAYPGRHPVSREWLVRERDAHAWVELWDAARATWVTIEATPPAGRPSAYPRPGLLRLAGEWIGFGWRRLSAWIVRLNIIALLADGGAAFFHYARRALGNPLGALLALSALVVLWRRLRRARRPASAADAQRLALEGAMTRLARQAAPSAGRREPSETWDAWLRRVRATLPADDRARLETLAEAYQCLRYGTAAAPDSAGRWLKLARGWRRDTSRQRSGSR